MRALFFQHVPFEGPGSIEPWLRSIGAKVSGTKFFEAATLPPLQEIDLLIVMGGPMSVNDEADLPWLASEKRFIRQAIEAEKAVVGICLGAQLIASAMGARVYPNKTKEIGWFPISSAQAGRSDNLFSFPSELIVFHWHGETFDLPAGAMHLARSRACENQAFQLGRRAIGLQFHLETAPQTAREIVTNCRSELTPSSYVQSEAQILTAPAKAYDKINSVMVEILKFVTRSKG